MRGKSYNGVALPFGERTQFRILTDDKYEDRWTPGVYASRLVETDEFILLTDKGILKSRSVKRYADHSDRYNLEFLANIKGLPRNPTGGELDGSVQKSGKDFLVSGAGIRRMYITDKMLRDFGRTDGCPRCENYGATHSEECRRRFEEKMKASGQAFDTTPGQSTVETPIIVESKPSLVGGSSGLGSSSDSGSNSGSA